MSTYNLLTGGLVAFTGCLLLVLPCLLSPPIARWLSRQLEARLGLDAYRRRTHSPATERVLEFLEFALYGRREYGAWTGAVPRLLAGLVVEPGGGVGPARLGISPAQVVAVLGRSLGDDAWDDGNLNDSLIYEGVRLRFDQCDSRGPLRRSRLCEIEVRRADAVLFDRLLFDWGEGELAAELTRRGFHPRLSESGYAEFTSPYLRAWFEGGRLARVEVAE